MQDKNHNINEIIYTYKLYHYIYILIILLALV